MLLCMTPGISSVSNKARNQNLHLKEEKHTADSPLQYSSLIFTLQLILLVFLRAQRGGTIVLYVQSFDKLAAP